MWSSNKDDETRGSGETGVIESVGTAFGLLSRRPYLVWIVIVIDLMRWSGPRVTIEDAFVGLRPGITEGTGFIGDTFERFAEIDVVSLLTWTMPNLIGATGFQAVSPPAQVTGVDLGSGAESELLLVLSFVLSIGLFMTLMTVAGRIVSDQPATGFALLRDIMRSTLGVAGVTLLGIALIMFMTVPFALIAAGLSLFNVDSFGLLAVAFVGLTVWLGLFFLFAIPALALGERNIFQALRSSYQVVQRNFLAVVGLLLLIVVIRAGTPHALSIFEDSQWSVPFAIVVNAFVATGLITALLFFFQNRAAEHSFTTERSTAAASG